MFGDSSHETRREFQKSLDVDQMRRSRFDDRLNLRKQSREEHLQKRRKELSDISSQIHNIHNIPNNMQQLKIKANADYIPSYVNQVFSSDPKEILKGATAFRELLSIERKPPIDRIMPTGVVPRLIHFMRSDNDTNLEFECAWAISNIASLDSQYTKAVIKHGAIEGFLKLLKNGKNENLIEMSIYGLGNVAGDSKEHQEILLKTDILEIISSRFDSYNLESQRIGMWCISNLCRKPNGMYFKKIISQCLPIICQTILEKKDEKIMGDSLWALSYISDYGDNEVVEALNNFKILEVLIGIMAEANKQHKHFLSNSHQVTPKDMQSWECKQSRFCQPCMRIVGNIVTGTDEQTQLILNEGFLDNILFYLNHSTQNVRREIIWCLSNIGAGNNEQIEEIISREWLMKDIMKKAKFDTVPVRTEVAYLLCNMASEGSRNQVAKLVEYEIIEVLVSMLSINDNETLIAILLEGFERIFDSYSKNSFDNNPYVLRFESSGGLDSVEKIEMSEKLSETMYQKIVEFIKKYWPQDDTSDMINNNDKRHYTSSDFMEPKTDNITNQFSFGFNNINSTGNNPNNHNNLPSVNPSGFASSNLNSNNQHITFKF